jgi:dipeptidyl aminopeptidase/acylaminoacyl peptidase
VPDSSRDVAGAAVTLHPVEDRQRPIDGERGAFPVSRFVLVLWALLAPVAGAAAERLPLEYFTRHDDFGEIEISPDGAYLAVSVYAEGEGRVAFYTVSPFKGVYALRAGEGADIADFEWASPTRLIYAFAMRQVDTTAPGWTGEIFAINRDGGSHKIVYGYRAGQDYISSRTPTRLQKAEPSLAFAEVISDLPGDDRNVLVLEHPTAQTVNSARYDRDARPLVTLVDIHDASKKVVDVLPLADAYPVLDQAHRVRFVVGRTAEGRQAVAWKPADEWVSFELPGFRPDMIVPEHIAGDGRSALFTGTRENESLSALYRLDLESRRVESVYAHPEADIAGVIKSLDEKDVIGVRVEPDKPLHHWLLPDDPTAKLYQMLERAFPGQAVRISSSTADHRLAIAFVYSDVNPGDYYLLDTQSRKAEFLAPGRSWVDPAKMRRREPIRVESRDGLVLHGYLTRPRDDAGPYPLVVLPHGGPHFVRDLWGYDWEAQLLAHYGYAVLQVNYRGSSGYGYDFQHAGYGEWGGKMQDDLTDATLWAVAEKIADRDNICIYGSSYGGYAALMGAVREPSLYRCAVSYVGVSDLELMFEKGDIPESSLGRKYLEEVLGSDPQSLRARSPLYNVERIQAPILLMHGKADWRVDYAHATRMRDALEKAGKKVELVAQRREGHGSYDEKNRKEVYVSLLAFFAQHLRGGQPYTGS